jgi:serine phosphatase RsbU (regulator of sigma subunit)/DNA-binding transcriptional regulator YhcF (GntR family)
MGWRLSMLLNLTDLSADPLHKQIANQLADLIITGELTPGTELPPVRTFAKEQHVSKSTIERAYSELGQQGLLKRNRARRLIVPALSAEDRQVIALTRHNGRHSLFAAIETFSSELISALDCDMISRMAGTAVQRFLYTRRVHIGLYDDADNSLRLAESGGAGGEVTIGGTDPFWLEVRRTEVATLIYTCDIEEQTSSLFSELRRRGARVILPLHDKDRCLGLIAVGDKRNGTDFSLDDISLLKVLANQFVTAIATARLYVESLEKRRMDEELRIAHEIQMNLLPAEPREQDGFSIWASTTPSHTVGGDFYDYFVMDGPRLGLVIADASGHGMPAAILMSQIQAVVRSEIGNGNTMSRTIASLNSQLHRRAGSGFFATLFYGVIDRSTGTLEYVNAGHDFPILVRRNGETIDLKSTGPALGVLPDAEHGIASVPVQEGDCILLFTDGITDTMSCGGKQYGASRLRDVVIGNRHREPKEIIGAITRDLEWFSTPGRPDDDRTLMVVKLDHLDQRITNAA